MRRLVVDEKDAEVVDLPGRRLSWLVTSGLVGAEHCSMCMIRVAPGETVRPAHSHPNGEEVIYIVTGSGRALIDGVVHPVHAGTAVLFPQGQIHMLQNSGTEEMKVVCFFAPPSSLDTYKFFDDIDFPTS
jgi:quercetin dioxygenase-like cupin family protein